MEKRITIGIPINRNVSPKFTISLQKVIHYLTMNGWATDINYNDGTVLSNQRNKLFKQAYKQEMNLMFIDSDMIFTDEDFEKVYKAAGDDYLTGGLCFMRRPPFQPVCFSEDRVEAEHAFIGYKIENMPFYPFKCAAVGCAFLFIPYNVMDKIYNNYDKPFNIIEMENGDTLGEDLSFFHRCNKIGIETICVPNVNVGHLTERIICRRDHEAIMSTLSCKGEENESK